MLIVDLGELEMWLNNKQLNTIKFLPDNVFLLWRQNYELFNDGSIKQLTESISIM